MVAQTRNQNRPPKLGVVAISYNETIDMPGFIAHLVPWVDEIVIVDDGSTDDTEALAKAGGDKVCFVDSPRQSGEGFNHQRNKGIDAATAEWLLHMDIDERVPPRLATEILRRLRTESVDAYRFRRLNFFLHQPMAGGVMGRWNDIHLAKRTVLRFEESKGPVFHETVVLEPQAKVGQLDEVMWHLNDKNFADRMRKNAQYSTKEAERIANSRRKLRPLSLLAGPVRAAIRTGVRNLGRGNGMAGLIWTIYQFAGTFTQYAMAWEKLHGRSRQELEAEISELWQSSGLLPSPRRPADVSEGD